MYNETDDVILTYNMQKGKILWHLTYWIILNKSTN